MSPGWRRDVWVREQLLPAVAEIAQITLSPAWRIEYEIKNWDLRFLVTDPYGYFRLTRCLDVGRVSGGNASTSLEVVKRLLPVFTEVLYTLQREYRSGRLSTNRRRHETRGGGDWLPAWPPLPYDVDPASEEAKILTAHMVKIFAFAPIETGSPFSLGEYEQVEPKLPPPLRYEWNNEWYMAEEIAGHLLRELRKGMLESPPTLPGLLRDG